MGGLNQNMRSLWKRNRDFVSSKGLNGENCVQLYSSGNGRDVAATHA